MRKHLVRTGNSVTLELEESELEKLGIEKTTEVDVSIEGRVLLVSLVRDDEDDEAFKRAVDKVNQRYEGLFRRLSK